MHVHVHERENFVITVITEHTFPHFLTISWMVELLSPTEAMPVSCPLPRSNPNPWELRLGTTD